MSLAEKVKGWMQYPAFSGIEFDKLGSFVASERQKYTIYPERENIFKAFEFTQPENVKVVIVGQDPYTTPGDATGLAFECGNRLTPPWKKVIEIYDIDFPHAFSPDVYDGKLEPWAAQGVLLLNTALTVRKGIPGSHVNQYREFTSSLLKSLMMDQSPKVFLVWGKFAKVVVGEVPQPHFAIYSDHPASVPYNSIWNAKGIFVKTNEFLKRNGLTQIDW